MNDVAVDSGFAFVQLLGDELASNSFNLPRFPETALRIQEALKDPDISIASLSNIVLTEPMLTVRLLKMANSAMMKRGPMEVTDVKVAMSRIGLNMVQSAAMSIAADEAFQAPTGSLLSMRIKKIRSHSIKVCALAYVLAKKVPGTCNPDDAMLTGLLHSIGKFYILARADESPELIANEVALESLLNDWYTGVGRAIVDFWGFPAHIVDAVDEHESIDRVISGNADLTDIIIVANFLAKAEQEKDEVQETLDQMPSVLRMNLDGETVLNYIQESDEEISSMMQALAG
ncbi:MAG: HDOD domain-containing protein [Moritella sp.]|uniref:HDOD domain-containing protein n=1 Tax=Moritella sp. TaxID=78556 RepID=UPI0029ACAFC5|nr:HDOD domain-containing protein [Moritella sp.]MDX2320736.1 HDOD domain-containing protein [Moritella sp.]